MENDSTVARWGARQFFFLPYHDAEMSLAQKDRTIVYHSERTSADAPAAAFDAAWTFGEPLPRTEADSLAFFLTERYCLYSVFKEQLYRCRVFHDPWPLRAAELSSHDSTVLEALGLPTPAGDPVLHYAEALKVDIWPLCRVAEGTRDSLFDTANASESLG